MNHLQTKIYPGILFFLQARQANTNEALTDISTLPAVCCADPCLQFGSDSFSSREFHTFGTIPHAAVDTELSALLLSNSAHEINIDSLVSNWANKEMGLLHLACHGNHGQGSDSFLLLGRPWGIGEILGSALKPKVVLLSACLAGRSSDDQRGNPLGIASAFLLRGAQTVIGSGIEIPDILMPLFVGLLHYHARESTGELDWGRAASLAREQFGDASWPEAFVPFFADAYAKALLATRPPKTATMEQWSEIMLGNLHRFDETLGNLSLTLGRSNEEAWQQLITSKVIQALDRIQDDHHPNRRIMRDISLFMQIIGG